MPGGGIFLELAAIFSTAFVVGLSGAMMPGPLLTVTIGESARRGFAAGPLIVLGHALLEGALVVALALGLAAILTAPVVGKVIAVVGGFFLIYMGWGMGRDAWLGRVELAVGRGRPGEGGPGAPGHPPGEQAMAPPVAVLNGAAVNSAEAAKVLAEPAAERQGCAGFTEQGEAFPPGGGPGTGECASCSLQAVENHPATGGGMHPVLAGILISLSNPYWSLWWATVGLGYIVLSLKQGVPGLASFFSGHILSDLAWYGLVAAAVAGGRRFLTPVLYRGILVACG
ncbi:MAG: LysE family transporter, partial [Thermoanaerobacteraceae bacterium]|nr:LysE family transporter [Thermoanaerobacteraceae bacterium]